MMYLCGAALTIATFFVGYVIGYLLGSLIIMYEEKKRGRK